MRKSIEQILEIRSRNSRNLPFLTAFWRIADIRDLLQAWPESRSGPSPEALRQTPVGLVACMEAYFKGVIKDLVDSDSPFLECAAKLNVEIDLSKLVEVHKKTFTFGELVGYSLLINKRDDIDDFMTKMLGFKFMNKLRRVAWSSGVPGEHIISDPNKVFADVDEVFRLRHIVCHEFGNVDISIEDARRYVENVLAFLQAAQYLCTDIVLKDIQKTQPEQNQYFEHRFKDADKQLRKAVNSLESKLEAGTALKLRNLQKAWRAYRDTDTKLILSTFERKSSHPRVRAQRREELTKRRIQEIEDLERWLIPIVG